MLSFGKNKNRFPMVASQTGTFVRLEDVPDEVFSGKILGEGSAILPTDGKVYSPVNGTVMDITESLHAISIVAEGDIDVLIHVGIDTVQLKGRGFHPIIKSGDKVKAGDLLMEVDLELIKESGFSPCTPTVIVDMEGISFYPEEIEETIGGQTVVAYYEKE